MFKMIRSSVFNRRVMLCGIAFFALGIVFYAQQAGALRVTLKRIMFDEKNRTEVLTVINNSGKPETYRLGWRRMRMTTDKSLVYVEDDDPAPDLSPAEKFIRFAPRRFTVKPGKTQQIRLMARYPKDLPDGEYRSHLWIQPEADTEAFKTEPSENTGKPSVKLMMLTGITMPVIVRKGKQDLSLSLDKASVSLQGEKLVAQFRLNRQGNISAYGDMEFSCSGGTSDVVIRQVRGLAVYTEVDYRDFTFKLPAPEGGLQACPSLKMTYIETGKEGVAPVSTIVPIQR